MYSIAIFGQFINDKQIFANNKNYFNIVLTILS